MSDTIRTFEYKEGEKYICHKCGYTDEKGIFYNYFYLYDPKYPHICDYDIRNEMYGRNKTE